MRGWMCLLAVAALVPSVPGFAEPLSAAKWLVDLGRDYALSPQAGLSDADAEITLLFMEAASRIDPELAEAHLWQYDMLTALGRGLEAREQLGAYVRLEPSDVAAHLNWLALTIESLQTAEARAKSCRAYLERGNLPKEVSSDLHRRLSAFHYNRGETSAAESEAAAALQDYAFNLAARMVQDQLRDAARTPTPRVPGARRTAAVRRIATVRRIELLLAMLEMSPADAETAWLLANELRSLGMSQQADRWYHHAAAVYALIPPGTPPPALEADQQKEVPTTQPAPPEIHARLEAFPSRVLDYPLHPEAYLSLSLSVGAEPLPPGEPWRCMVRLENTGPFPITFGQEMMVVPDVLCSVRTRGDQTRTSGPTIRISLNRQLRLMPGRSIELVQTLDVGPIRASMIGTPQVAHDVEITAVLSPVATVSASGEEEWAPGVGGLAAKPVRFSRSSFAATPEALSKLVARSRAGDVTTRIAVTELLAMLLAEHQHLAARRLQYRVPGIDAATVQAAVLERAADPEWHVRARVAECMRWFVLDKNATRQATGFLSDRHWLVRGLTLRTLADHYRDKFRPVLEHHAKADPEEWTRRLSSALLVRMIPTTQPADSD